MNKTKTMRGALVFALILVAVALTYWWREHSAPSAAKTSVERAVPVRIAVAEMRDVSEVISVSGFVTPVNVVDIRPQITSTVRRVDIKEGQTVQVGQLMFVLDSRGDEANADKAGAQVGKDQALLEDARRTLARNSDLKARGFVSQSAVDSAKSNVDALVASVRGDRAAVTGAGVTVGFSAVAAPMSGRVGEIKVHIGSLVQPNSTQPMTTITQIAPIDVAFNIPEREVQKLLKAQRAGAVPVTARIENRTVSGQLSFVDSAVDSATGSLRAKARFDNRDSLLWAGTLVNVDLSVRTLSHAVVISPRAVQVGPKGQFVYRVEPDGTVSSRPITVDYLTGDLAVVQGVAAGSRVVIEGGQNLRPGIAVTVVQADNQS
ncbi:MAG TPA: efflux RND transporter periplasmic adaptor subunit [Casimicrobiaceae bacterium]|nr:efflux RND transporter periplasmic adaptor subunit [Casimicrobiaceae bacterium]